MLSSTGGIRTTLPHMFVFLFEEGDVCGRAEAEVVLVF